MRADRQTYRHADRNISPTYQGEVTTTAKNDLVTL